ncbi:MAG: hypothetical protein KatS3mg060_0087 [Dehalococcoidia bacterium]|nr:MAG: hypothetical protein KatS3mg060_0087 [Dehalococcoidia bacterium]
MCFPTTHPLWADSGDATPFVADADVLLSIDMEVPYIPGRARPPADGKHIKIDLDPINPSVPLQGFPVDVAIQADSLLAIEALTVAVRERLRGSRGGDRGAHRGGGGSERRASSTLPGARPRTDGQLPDQPVGALRHAERSD